MENITQHTTKNMARHNQRGLRKGPPLFAAMLDTATLPYPMPPRDALKFLHFLA